MTLYAIYIDGVFQNDVREFIEKPDVPGYVEFYEVRSELSVACDCLAENLVPHLIEDHYAKVRTVTLRAVPKSDEEIFGMRDAAIEMSLEQENRLRTFVGDPILTRLQFRERFIERLRASLI